MVDQRHTLHLPLSLEQCLQLEHDLHAVQMPVGLQVPARTAAEGRKSIVIRIRGSNVFIKNIVLRLCSVKGKP